jgi:hypothetical protein
MIDMIRWFAQRNVSFVYRLDRHHRAVELRIAGYSGYLDGVETGVDT